MRTALLTALLIAMAPIAGCIGNAQPADDPAGAEAEPAAANASSDAVEGLSTPPTWEPGEWWKIRFTDPTPEADGATYTTTRVVAGVGEDHYRVGMPPAEFSDEMLIWHMPGFGEIGREDLGYPVHGERFTALEFPLEESKTWSANFQASLTAEVVDVTGNEATVNYTTGGPNSRTAMQLVYNGTHGYISSLESFQGPVFGSAASHGAYEVLDHGHGYEGEIMVPENPREVFFRGRLAGAVGFSQPLAGPQGSAEVPEDVDRVTLGHVLGEVHGQAPTTGLYRVTTTPPGGTAIQDQVLPGSSPGRHVTYHGVWEASGTWSFEHVAAGTGATVAEGIGYGVQNTTLPASS